jgi:anti-sigma-K factor RskA
MNYADPELRERLAAEYVLGTLRGPARNRFERLLASDTELAGLVQDWEARVNLLAESAPAVEPPAHVWDRIARQIGPAPVPMRERWFDRWWASLGFWRGATALAAATAAALAVHVALQPPGMQWERIATLDQRLARIERATQGVAGAPGEIAALATRLAGIESRLNAANLAPSHVAVLIDKYRRPMMTADLDVTEGRLALRLNITPPRDFTDRVLEIWMTQADGTSRSLGLFPSEKSGTMTVLVLSRETAVSLAKGELAVSLEPSGGSTTRVPSGPVLFSGPVMPVDL